MDGREGAPVRWRTPEDAGDEALMEPWRRAVGPALTALPEPPPHVAEEAGVAVVSWNARVGGGGIQAFFRAVRRLTVPAPLVLLLQEVYSGGDHVPSPPPRGARHAEAIDDEPEGEPREDVAAFLREVGRFGFYAPSMRNGGGPEDRGNAIVSDLPMSELEAIELPFERQRRVAVAATVRVGGASVRVCSTHLDNRAPWRRAWRSLGAARARQMAGLLRRLGPGEPAVLGGDLNTWVGGIREGAFRMAREAYPDPARLDPRPTHRFELGSVLRRSDHLLFRLPPGWTARVRRLDETFGSDHYPLIGHMEATAGA